MKIEINKNHLHWALTRANDLIAGKTTLPALSAVLVKVDPAGSTISASNLTAAIVVTITPEIIKPGIFTLPARAASKMVAAMSGNTVTIASRGGEIELSDGISKFVLNSLDPQEFPAIPDVDAEPIAIDQATFRSALRRVAFAQGSDESRMVLNGTYLEGRPGKLSFAASDGHRLAVTEIDAPDVEAPFAAIIHSQAVSYMIRGLSEGAATLKVSSTSTALQTPHVKLISKSIAGKYPEYRRLLREEPGWNATFDRDQLIATIERVALADPRRLYLDFYSGSLCIRSINPELGTAEESIPFGFSGEEFTLSLVPQYLLDVLRDVDLDLFIKVHGHNKATHFIGKDYIYAVMPMMISTRPVVTTAVEEEELATV